MSYSVIHDLEDCKWYVLDENGSTIDGPFSTHDSAENIRQEHEWDDEFTVSEDISED